MWEYFFSHFLFSYLQGKRKILCLQRYKKDYHNHNKKDYYFIPYNPTI